MLSLMFAFCNHCILLQQINDSIYGSKKNGADLFGIFVLLPKCCYKNSIRTLCIFLLYNANMQTKVWGHMRVCVGVCVRASSCIQPLPPPPDHVWPAISPFPAHMSSETMLSILIIRFLSHHCHGCVSTIKNTPSPSNPSTPPTHVLTHTYNV